MQIKIISILGAAVILLGVTVGLLIKRIDTVKTERDQAIEFNNARTDSVEYFKNAWGREAARVEVRDLTIRNMNRMHTDERLSWIRQFESVNKRMNNLESATRTVARVVGEWEVPITTPDTPRVVDDWSWVNDTTWLIPDIRLFDNRDEWIRIQGTITADTVVVHADAKVPVESVVVWQRKKFLGLLRMWPAGKEWFSETASPNPYVRITESTVVRVGKRKKR
jgi:hypothetical protein